MAVINFGLGQLNLTVGALRQNTEKMREVSRSLVADGAQILIFPELAICGYPPEDLVFKEHFVAKCVECAEQLAADFTDTIGIFGTVWPEERRAKPFNAAAICFDGKIQHIYKKTRLPNYSVFDEERYFETGESACVIHAFGTRIGISICEDIWFPGGVCQDEVLYGAEYLVNLSASPYHRGKIKTRSAMLAQRARDYASAVVYCNLVGGQDELVFDGSSVILRPDGSHLYHTPSFQEDAKVVTVETPIERGEIVWRGQVELPEEAVIAPFEAGPVSLHSPAANPELSDLEEVYAALCLGVRDYVEKNGFASVIIAVSGGIDSALTAAIACDALGAQKVRGVYMPSQYSSQVSAEDAAELARNFGFDLLTIPIERIVREYGALLEPLFRGRAPDITEENLQARIRGTLIMALSNKFGYLVLATGNKSEFSTGYATLYGDMAGGLCVLKDVSKTLVYQLARYRNRLPDGVKIPERTITRAPSAELKPNQLDTDSLPEYGVLDPIVEMYVEEDKSGEEIIAAGYDADTVRKVVRLIHLAEYKRRQGAIGIRITPRAFGRDRRMPITNAFREWDI